MCIALIAIQYAYILNYLSDAKMNGKVHIFWEGHKFLRNLHNRLEISQKFIAFSEDMNFVAVSLLFKIAKTVTEVTKQIINTTYLT